MVSETEKYKYQLVSIDNMNAQVNVRFPKKLLKAVEKYADDYGYSNVQDFIRETIREKIFPETLELTDWAKKKLAEARKQPESTYVGLDELRDKIQR